MAGLWPQAPRPAGEPGATVGAPGRPPAPGEDSFRRPQPRRAAADELARLLMAGSGAAVEQGGATAVLAAIAGGPLTAKVEARAACTPTEEDRRLLGALAARATHERAGLLRTAGGQPAAVVSATVATGRVPQAARAALSITASGELVPGPATVPLGRALRGLGVSREQLGVAITRGRRDEAGEEIALGSVARLWCPSGWPLAVVTEWVYARFLEACPPPWPQARALVARRRLPGDGSWSGRRLLVRAPGSGLAARGRRLGPGLRSGPRPMARGQDSGLGTGLRPGSGPRFRPPVPAPGSGPRVRSGQVRFWAAGRRRRARPGRARLGTSPRHGLAGGSPRR